MGDQWQEFEVIHHTLSEYRKMTGKTDLPEYFITADKISWEGRVDTQAAIQRHIDHSLSSTINLPVGTSPQVVGTIYKRAWQKGLKGVTVYVEGSRSGVLVNKPEKQDTFITYKDAPKRPSELPCVIHHWKVKGQKWIIIVGLLKDKPYEIFAGPADIVDIPSNITDGVLIKHSRKSMNSKYDLRYGDDGSTVLKDIVSWFEHNDYGTLSRMVSMSLRHGVPIQFIVEQLQKDQNDDLWSFNRVLARVLKKWVKDGIKRDKTCPSCGDTNGLVYEEGCLKCLSCSYSKCG